VGRYAARSFQYSAEEPAVAARYSQRLGRNESGREATESNFIRVIVGDGNVGDIRSAEGGANRHAENGIGDGRVFHGSLPDNIETDPRDRICGLCGESISAVPVCRGVAVCTGPADTHGRRTWEKEKTEGVNELAGRNISPPRPRHSVQMLMALRAATRMIICNGLV